MNGDNFQEQQTTKERIDSVFNDVKGATNLIIRAFTTLIGTATSRKVEKIIEKGKEKTLKILKEDDKNDTNTNR